MATVIRAYHTHFWLWFKIAAPAVIISTTAIILGRNQTQEILRHLPRVYGLPDVHQFEIAKIWLIQLVAGLVSWIASALSFGATCMAMREIESGTIPAPSDCFAAVLRRLSPFVRLSLILYFFGWVVAVAGFWAEPALVWLLRHQSHFSVDLRIVWLISFASMAFFFLVLSRFALAIPALVLDNYGVAQAMFRSDEVTEGKWIVLAAILAKSTIGGYVAAMSPFWLAQWIIPPSLALRSWFPWVLTVASMVGVSAVEPTMFVGFVSLYLRTSPFVPRQTHLVNRQLA